MINLELTVDEVNLILKALQELPYAVVAPLIAKVKTEGDKQLEEHLEKDKLTKTQKI